jgi:hypothetical protein
MTIWTKEELKKFETVDELDLSSFRSDGSLRNPVTIWAVRVEDDIFIRAVKGRSGPWFRGTKTRHEGHIRLGGVEKDVMFVEETDPDVNEKIDAAYREKYHRYPREYIDACLTPAARSATIRLVPRQTVK